MNFDDATSRQVHAANPRASSWVSANAGSGKTRVLTNRVARMLFAGIMPARILCLTYTKAAASEMQVRLFETLGQWAMAPDDQLRTDLERLGEDGPFDDADLRRARQMFATAIETPGGLKIQTIHAFCSSVLRRFPLEAGISPEFRELDDRTSRRLRSDVLDEVALKSGDVFDALAAFAPGDLDGLAASIVANADEFDGVDSANIWKTFGLSPGFDDQDLEASLGFCFADSAAIRAFCEAPFEAVTDQKNAGRLSVLIDREISVADMPVLEAVLLTGSGAKNPFSAKIGSIPTKAGRTLILDHSDQFENLAQRVETARHARISLFSARKTLSLHIFASVFLHEYEHRKSMSGWVDFDDLIRKTLTLLSDRRAAEWVLFRLDGGIDHILVDEAQDTSPRQWDVIECLAREFTAGLGAREDVERTIFVVGDRKQSIYSFQGAAPQAFDDMRNMFSDRLLQVGATLESVELSHSFRSAPAILEFVDKTLEPFTGLAIGDHLNHVAYFPENPGRVDVWPLFEPNEEKPEKPPFGTPVDLVAPGHPSRRLAASIANEIGDILARGDQITENGVARAIRPGDFLILVQKRSGILFKEVLRCLKAANLPVAGSDVLDLAEELSVKDIQSFLSFLATPDDSLSLAEAMRSPLLGLSEETLFQLAHGRAKGHTVSGGMARG